jgi:branched-chain amino acid transport system substrate-binding protein
MADQVSRREFLNRLGVTVTSAAALSATAGVVSSLSEVQAAESPKGTIPSKPYKVGHITYFTGFGAVFGEQSYKGHVLAAEEIDAKGGLLGKRKIETIWRR